MQDLNLFIATPEFLLLGLGFLILLGSMYFRHSEHVGHTLTWVGVGGLSVTLFYLLLGGLQGVAFYDTFHLDTMALFFKVVFVLTGILVLLLSYNYLSHFIYKGEYVALLIFGIVAMMFLSSANELMTLFLALETTTLTFYFFAAFNKDKKKSSEAGLKMYVQGVLSSAILLYGLSLFYGMSGTTFLSEMQTPLQAYAGSPLLILATVLVIAGFGFKIAIAPFHMWVPDVYEGAPTPVTAFLSVASKAAGLVVLTRFFYVAIGDTLPWPLMFAGLALLTMSLGNLIAIPQQNIKRMIAYSSIAHVGYILIGLVAFSPRGMSSILLYVLVYSLANLLLFATVGAVSEKVHSHHISKYAGLGRNSPFVAATMVIGFLSLIGLPPFGGFIGKLYLFASGLETGHYLLVLAAVINSVISVYYYLNVVRYMYLEKGDAEVSFSVPQTIVAVVGIVLLIVIGIFPKVILGFF